MTLLRQTLPDGSPSPAAVFTNATLISALYHNDQRPFQQYAAASGCELVAFNSNKDSFNPDYAVLVRPGEAFVVLDGTTNVAQWLAHIESALFPLIDTATGNTVCGSFYAGLRGIESTLLDAIRPAGRDRIVVTGHSYGAGAAKIWVDHLRVLDQPFQSIELMTFGEPKSSGNFARPASPYTHNRIIGRLNSKSDPNDAIGLDPVVFMPPGVLQCLKWPLIASLPLSWLGFKFQFFGTAWALNTNGLARLSCFDNFLVKFDPTGWLYIGESASWPFLHLVDGWYLPYALKLWQTMSPQVV